MHLLDLTLPSPEENLALDEALLNAAEVGEGNSELLRLWESPTPFVVVGRASRLADEVNLEACRAQNVPVLRRCSGGTAVVVGAGCLMYAVILSYESYPHLRIVDQAHAFVMNTMRSALGRLHPGVKVDGLSDLVLGNSKISGNSLRCKRHCLLYHGTILYDFPLGRVAEWLGVPPRQPDYRQGRSHAEFVANFPFDVASIRSAVCDAWGTATPITKWPAEETGRLVAEQYSLDTWNQRL